MLKVFWSYFPEVGVVKVPCYNERCLWVCGFLLGYTPEQFLECLFCVGLGGGGGGGTPVIMTAVNSLGSQNGRHSRVRYSRSGEHKDLTECMFLSWHHELLIKKQTPPPLLFPVNSFILSARRISRVRWLNLESPDS